MTHRPFNLDEAKAGHPIQTRDGRPAKFIAHVPEANGKNVVVLIDGFFAIRDETGLLTAGYRDDADLVMAPRKRTVWVNMYQNSTQDAFWYETEREANESADEYRIGNRAYPIEIEE